MNTSDIVETAKRRVGRAAALTAATFAVAVLILVYWMLISREYFGWFCAFSGIIIASCTVLAWNITRKDRKLVFREMLETRDFIQEIMRMESRYYEREERRLKEELAANKNAGRRSYLNSSEKINLISDAINKFRTLMPK
jgi:hypothetical protein